MAKKEKLSLEELLEQALVKDEDKPYAVPSNWVWSRLSVCCNKLQYGYTMSSNSEEVGPHFLRITDIQDNLVNWNEVPYCEISKEDYIKYRLFKNDIVVARTGATTGKSFLINEETDAVFASYLIRLSLEKGVLPKYLWFFMNSEYYWFQIMIEKTGTAQPGVNASKLGLLFFPLPPLPEQQRIVDLIDSLFVKLDRAKELVQMDNIDNMKKSILARAFRGELGTNNPNEESALDLLKEVLRERVKVN